MNRWYLRTREMQKKNLQNEENKRKKKKKKKEFVFYHTSRSVVYLIFLMLELYFNTSGLLQVILKKKKKKKKLMTEIRFPSLGEIVVPFELENTVSNYPLDVKLLYLNPAAQSNNMTSTRIRKETEKLQNEPAPGVVATPYSDNQRYACYLRHELCRVNIFIIIHRWKCPTIWRACRALLI